MYVPEAHERGHFESGKLDQELSPNVIPVSCVEFPSRGGGG